MILLPSSIRTAYLPKQCSPVRHTAGWVQLLQAQDQHLACCDQFTSLLSRDGFRADPLVLQDWFCLDDCILSHMCI